MDFSRLLPCRLDLHGHMLHGAFTAIKRGGRDTDLLHSRDEPACGIQFLQDDRAVIVVTDDLRQRGVVVAFEFDIRSIFRSKRTTMMVVLAYCVMEAGPFPAILWKYTLFNGAFTRPGFFQFFLRMLLYRLYYCV